jgi:hypothetical protein
MAPRWTVVIEIDPDLADAARSAAARAISRLAEEAQVELHRSSAGTFVAFTSDPDAADRLAAAARATHAVAAAYVKPPEALP